MKTTREQEIDNAKYAFHDSVFEEQSYLHPTDYFKAGAKWADENPKSPWISIKDDLPCNHSEMICGRENTDGTETIDVFCSNFYGHIWDDYMIYENGKWRWNDFEPDFWMISPKLPR